RAANQGPRVAAPRRRPVGELTVFGRRPIRPRQLKGVICTVLMRNLTAVFALSFATLVGCGLLKKPDPDAGTDAAVAPVDTTALAGDAAAQAGAGAAH